MLFKGKILIIIMCVLCAAATNKVQLQSAVHSSSILPTQPTRQISFTRTQPHKTTRTRPQPTRKYMLPATRALGGDAVLENKSFSPSVQHGPNIFFRRIITGTTGLFFSWWCLLLLLLFDGKFTYILWTPLATREIYRQTRRKKHTRVSRRHKEPL